MKSIFNKKAVKPDYAGMLLGELEVHHKEQQRRYWQTEKNKETNFDLLILGSFSLIIFGLFGAMVASAAMIGVGVGGMVLSLGVMAATHLHSRAIGKECIEIENHMDAFKWPKKKIVGEFNKGDVKEVATSPSAPSPARGMDA